MIASVLAPVLTLGGLGLMFGIGLSIAAKKFCVKTDPRFDEIIAKLPGANCGACGMPGCIGFAEGLIQGTCTVDKCAVTQEEERAEIADILGVERKVRLKNLACLHCHGGSRVRDRFAYSGIKDCIAANLVMAGQKECVYGCLGFGTCVRACPFAAITMGEDGLPLVDEDKCTACGKCVAICPKKLFSLVPATHRYLVRCKSLELGKKVMDVCSVGCIGCKKCEKACPHGAIKVVNNLAVIDYAACKDAGECFKACPTKAIAKKQEGRWTTE